MRRSIVLFKKLLELKYNSHTAKRCPVNSLTSFEKVCTCVTGTAWERRQDIWVIPEVPSLGPKSPSSPEVISHSAEQLYGLLGRKHPAIACFQLLVLDKLFRASFMLAQQDAPGSSCNSLTQSHH